MSLGRFISTVASTNSHIRKLQEKSLYLGTVISGKGLLNVHFSQKVQRITMWQQQQQQQLCFDKICIWFLGLTAANVCDVR